MVSFLQNHDRHSGGTGVEPVQRPKRRALFSDERGPAAQRGAAALALFLALLTGCAGYQIGNQTLYPTHIRTVYVPMFESTSFRRNLGERLTEAVQKEIEQKTPYKVTGRTDADSILVGRIVSETKRVVVGSRSGDTREVQVNLQVEVSWIDRKGNMVSETESVPIPEEVALVSGSGNVLPEAGQSIATGHQEAIHHLAEQIVSLMENPW